MLATLDWIVISAYLLFALLVGLAVRESAQKSRRSYFLADGTLPWWWAGTSIAATTFAADTPLAITGIVASKGLSGNWIWLSWVLVHAGVVVLFARMWHRTQVITDAEFIELRYSGKSASLLRSLRAALYGIIYNIIILGWVLRAMGKIVHPLFHWEVWTPRLTEFIGSIMPDSTALGGPSEVMTILVLVIIVAFYSSLGGIRGVIFTDLIQFALGLIGGIWLAVIAWNAAGGRSGLKEGLTAQFGEQTSSVTALIPSSGMEWFSILGMGAFMFGLYLIVQSFANVPADGGGYLQQRLNTTRSEKDAQKAAGLFLVIQYIVRVWPWFIAALAALVIIPIGSEVTVLGSLLGEMVANDREMAYSAMMITLLPAGVLGIVIISLLAAFMSTIDTHFNWGASYIVNDILLKIKPDLSSRMQIVAARTGVILFAIAAVFVAFHIERIEQAWQWVAALGAALGLPTMLRWVWWRINAAAELLGGIAGLTTAFALAVNGSMAYEYRLITIAGVSLVGVIAGIIWGPKTDRAVLTAFQKKVNPIGFWPGQQPNVAIHQLARVMAGTVLLASIVIGSVFLIKWVLIA